MSYSDAIRAWKDPKYRASLSDEEQALLPPHPVGLIELLDSELGDVAGARKPNTHRMMICPRTSCIRVGVYCDLDEISNLPIPLS